MRGCSQHYRWRNGGEAPGRRVSVVSAAHLGALLCLALCRPSFADSIKIFGVDVYLLEHPSCSGSSREVLAKASPFEKEARLADIITELARRTREAGANTLHSIRILSAAPYHGAEAIGIAVTCAITPDPPADLIALVAESRGAEAFAIRPTDPLGPERTLGKAEMELIRRLSEAELGTLKALIASGRQTQPGPTI